MIKTRSLHFRMTVLHIALLSVSLVLLCVSVYFGVRHYLDVDVRDFLSGQCHAIGEKLLTNVGQLGEQDVVSEMNEHYAPEVIEEFIRITRADGSVLYQSAAPRQKDFDPGAVFPIRGVVNRETFRRVNSGERSVVVNALPFRTKEGTYYLVEVGAPYRSTYAVLHSLFVHLALGTIVIILGAIAGGIWLTKRALKPVNSITERAEQISYLTIAERLPAIASGDEIERLSVALNRMIGRLEDAFRHVDQFSADVSHELRTPLTILQGELEEMGQHDLSPELRDMVGSSLEETARLARIIDHLLELSRIDRGEGCTERVCVNLGELAVSTAEQMRLLADEKRIALEYEVEPRVEVEGDPVRLRQIVANLLDNAVKYTPEDGSVKIVVTGADAEPQIRIIDTGVGIPASALPHIFDRFYRADWSRSRNAGGVGLGLSIVRAICVAHQAELSVTSKPGEGSAFTVEFKRAHTLHGQTRPAPGSAFHLSQENCSEEGTPEVDAALADLEFKSVHAISAERR